jgi:preprotein translocase subunit SecE
VGVGRRELLKIVLQVAAGIVVASVILFLIGALIEIAWR